MKGVTQWSHRMKHIGEAPRVQGWRILAYMLEGWRVAVFDRDRDLWIAEGSKIRDSASDQPKFFRSLPPDISNDVAGKVIDKKVNRKKAEA